MCPLVIVNCVAIPVELFHNGKGESALYNTDDVSERT